MIVVAEAAPAELPITTVPLAATEVNLLLNFVQSLDAKNPS